MAGLTRRVARRNPYSVCRLQSTRSAMSAIDKPNPRSSRTIAQACFPVMSRTLQSTSDTRKKESVNFLTTRAGETWCTIRSPMGSRTRSEWKAKKARDAEELQKLRDAVPVSSEELRAEARAQDAAILEEVRGWLERHPDHSNVPIWRAILEKGWWGTPEWREAARRTVPSSERHRPQPQGELF